MRLEWSHGYGTRLVISTQKSNKLKTGKFELTSLAYFDDARRVNSEARTDRFLCNTSR